MQRMEGKGGGRAALRTAKTRFNCDFGKNSTRVFGGFFARPFVSLLKHEYLPRQHNMLCFILDTPHRGRYFHDCVLSALKPSTGQKDRNRLQRNSGRAARSPQRRQRSRQTPTARYESNESGRPDGIGHNPVVFEPVAPKWQTRE